MKMKELKGCCMTNDMGFIYDTATIQLCIYDKFCKW